MAQILIRRLEDNTYSVQYGEEIALCQDWPSALMVVGALVVNACGIAVEPSTSLPFSAQVKVPAVNN